MIRRSLGAALWTLVGLLAGFLGALSSLVGTGAGRALLARVSEGALRQVFTGRAEIGDVRGSLLTGLTLTEVRLFDADTTLVAWLPQANLSYNPFDFAAGRVVLFEFDLRRPVINIVQHPSGRLNIEELLRLGGPDKGPHGPATLILFRNVRITDGTVILRLQAKRPAPGDSSVEIANDDPNGRLRVRRFEHLDARLSALQVSSPRERGIRIDISRLAMESSDPAVRVEDAVGRLRVIGDSMDVQLARVRLPHSALRDARGTLRWPHGPLLFDLRLRADSATLDDCRFIARRFAGVPGAGVVSGDVRLRSHGERLLEVGLDPLRLAYRGGTVVGRLTALSVADSGLVALRDADLDAREFDLDFARPFLDTLPFAGRLTGHTLATGPLAALALETDRSFRDSLVPGWPETRSRGKGEVNLKAADGMHFQPFAVEASSIDLGTVAQLAPAVRLHGTLSAAGTLTGPLRDAQFAGRLEHRDGARPPSVLTGNVRLDTRSEALRLYADVTADSLVFDGLRGSFPTLPLQGAVTGPVKLAGPLGALETHVDLHSRGGDVRGDGTLILDLPHYGAQDLQVTARDLDLAHWLGRVAPSSRLSFTINAEFAGDSAVPPLGTVQAILEPSQFAGAGLDSGAVRVRFADRRLYVDSLRVAGPRRPGPLHLATRSRPGVRPRGDPGLDRPRRLRILRCVRRCPWDAGLAHVAGALASRGGRRLPRRWTVRPPSRSTRSRCARGRPGFTGCPVPRRCVGAGAAHRADRDRLGGQGDRAGSPERLRNGQAGAPGCPADARSGGRPRPAGGLPAGGGVRAARAGHCGRGRDGHAHRRAVGHSGQPRLERVVLALERGIRRVSRAVRGRDVRLPRPAPAGRGAPVALGPANPRGAGVLAPGLGTRAGAAPPAPRLPVGRGKGGQRGPLRPRGAHARPAARDRRVLGGPGDRGDVGRAAAAGRAADRQRRRDHPDPQRALRGGQRAAHPIGRHDRHPIAVGPERAWPGRLHRHRSTGAADASRARSADRRGPVQGPGLEEQRGHHRQRPALAQGAGVWRHAHWAGQRDVGCSVLRRPRPEADRELG